jgi:hypothetical protein
LTTNATWNSLPTNLGQGHNIELVIGPREADFHIAHLGEREEKITGAAELNTITLPLYTEREKPLNQTMGTVYLTPC